MKVLNIKKIISKVETQKLKILKVADLLTNKIPESVLHWNFKPNQPTIHNTVIAFSYSRVFLEKITWLRSRKTGLK